MRFPRITPKRIIMDLSLTCVIATQLWHHIFLGGGLCELPTWERAVTRRTPRAGRASSKAVPHGQRVLLGGGSDQLS